MTNVSGVVSSGSVVSLTFETQAGQTLAWIDGQNGDWTDSADWRTAPTGAPGIPSAFDTAVLGGLRSYTVTISKTEQATADVLSWTNAQATLVVSGTLTHNDGLQSDGGTMEIRGGSLNLMVPSTGGTVSLDAAIIDLSDGGISAQAANLPTSGTAGGIAALTLVPGLRWCKWPERRIPLTWPSVVLRSCPTV